MGSSAQAAQAVLPVCLDKSGTDVSSVSIPERQRCKVPCNKCGCQGGPGYRTPPRNNEPGPCATWKRLSSECGLPPHDKCIYEGGELDHRCAVRPSRVSPDVQSEQIVGQDKDGKIVVFDLLLFDNGITWDFGSPDKLNQNSAPVNPETLKSILSGSLSNARSIVAIGTASTEGSTLEQ